jgi:hypothetical protein
MQWFDHPDPYDLAETERVAQELVQDDLFIIFRSSTRFLVGDYVKLSDPDLVALVTQVDFDGPGAAIETEKAVDAVTPTSAPGVWSIDDYLK